MFFRSEQPCRVSFFSRPPEAIPTVKIQKVLDLDSSSAGKTLRAINEKYKIVLTRGTMKAKRWLKEKTRGSERRGMIVSSNANPAR